LFGDVLGAAVGCAVVQMNPRILGRRSSFGIPAIVYAAKVDGLKARGDINGAVSASNSAKMWCMVSLGVWLVLIVIYVLFAVVVGVSGNH
jgi:hypothetical protein